MRSPAADLARTLARHAEEVCRHYLPSGRRYGHYWLVGDVAGSPGRSLYVRLRGPDAGPGAAGKWTDAATGEHGDLLDLIAANRGLRTFRDLRAEAHHFLALPLPEDTGPRRLARDGEEAAHRLFASGIPIAGTPGERYLRSRGITAPLDWPALRFHPRLWYRDDRSPVRQSWPGLLAAVTDLHGAITGVHRTWLDRQRPAKAPFPEPRRALGHLLGNGVRFGHARDVLLAGEGLETVLALKSVLPHLPMVAALSANHLAALMLPPGLIRLYVAQDDDAAGRMAADRLQARAVADGIAFHVLAPVLGDFNEDLCRRGMNALAHHLLPQLAPADAAGLQALAA